VKDSTQHATKNPLFRSANGSWRGLSYSYIFERGVEITASNSSQELPAINYNSSIYSTHTNSHLGKRWKATRYVFSPRVAFFPFRILPSLTKDQVESYSYQPTEKNHGHYYRKPSRTLEDFLKETDQKLYCCSPFGS
jgi:hypothetical protein